MKIHGTIKNQFMISTDKHKLNFPFIQEYLSKESYWAKNITMEIVKKSIEGSFCFGLYVHEIKKMPGETQDLPEQNNPVPVSPGMRQIGFARVITDFATFGYLADVFVIEKFRGKGLAQWLMETIMDQPELQGLRRWMLATKDAHGLYEKSGFLPLDKPERIMGFKPFEEYPKNNS